MKSTMEAVEELGFQQEKKDMLEESFKEALKKDLKDLKDGRKFAKKIEKNNYEYLWKGDTKILLRNLHGVDMRITKK